MSLCLLFLSIFCIFPAARAAAAPCNPAPCKNGATCTDLADLSGYWCTCAAGYTGTTCETTPCDGTPCNNGGTCANLADASGYWCTCAAGYTGATCDTTPCDGTPCQNGGTCANLADASGYWCTCAAGYTGTTCDTTPCAATPCQNGGTCANLADGSGYWCTCAAGYTGTTCDTTPCAATPCQNGGTCANLADASGFWCTCASGFTGTTCDTNAPCDAAPCQNGGTCTNLADGSGYWCTCAAGYTGTNCDTTPCDGGPCKNGATCANLADASGYTCTCASGYTGSTCETVECTTDPCQNGATCQMVHTTNTLCTCAAGYQGATCSDDRYVQTYKGCYKTDTSFTDCIKYKNPNTISYCFTTKMKTYTSATLPAAQIMKSATSHSDAQHCCWGSVPADSEKVADSKCSIKCSGDSSEDCAGEESLTDGGGNAYTQYYGKIYALTYDGDDCSGVSCRSDGHCIDKVGGYSCLCPPGKTGSDCTTDIDECTFPSPPCNSGSDYAGNTATLSCTNGDNAYTCNCNTAKGWSGTTCTVYNDCFSNPCKNSGTCTDEGSNYKCSCASGWTGSTCEERDNCVFPTAHTCVNGDCVDMTTDTFYCNCNTGWTGTNCDTDIDECAVLTPCAHGTCTQGPTGSGTYDCACDPGWTGTNCDADILECASSPCKSVDTGATCNEGTNGYTCTCTAKYTDKLCNLDINVWQIQVKFKDANIDLTSVEDVVNNPSSIVDCVPFLVGQLNATKQVNMSWDYTEIFDYCLFEGKNCQLPYDIKSFFEPSLGNCFTFNHEDVYLNFSHKDEYAPWTDVAGMRIFVHNQSESTHSESVGYSAPVGYESTFGLKWTVYKLYGSPYSQCVSDKGTLKWYYFDGDYSTEGCLRSCYQNEVYKVCQCHDPRYPKDSSITTCPLEKRTCVDNFIAAKGSPSDWDCASNQNCPLPCYRGEYAVSTSRAIFPDLPNKCLHKTGADQTACVTDIFKNRVKVEVYFEDMAYVIFTESPRYPPQKVIADVGGQLGILCGMSCISMTEVVFTLTQMLFAWVTGLH